MAHAITCIEDLRILARRRAPRMFYDYADSGAWTEQTYRANEADFQRIYLRQRVGIDMSNRTLASTIVDVRRRVQAMVTTAAVVGKSKRRNDELGLEPLPLPKTVAPDASLGNCLIRGIDVVRRAGI